VENLSQSYRASPAVWNHLPLDAGKRTPLLPEPERPVLDLSTPDGWKAELFFVLDIYWDGLSVRRQFPI